MAGFGSCHSRFFPAEAGNELLVAELVRVSTPLTRHLLLLPHARVVVMVKPLKK